MVVVWYYAHGIWLLCGIMLTEYGCCVVSCSRNMVVVWYHAHGTWLLCGKTLNLLKKTCKDASGNSGVCIFKWNCINKDGVLLSTCTNGFFYLTCCKLPSSNVTKEPIKNVASSSSGHHYTTHEPLDGSSALFSLLSTTPTVRWPHTQQETFNTISSLANTVKQKPIVETQHVIKNGTTSQGLVSLSPTPYQSVDNHHFTSFTPHNEISAPKTSTATVYDATNTMVTTSSVSLAYSRTSTKPELNTKLNDFNVTQSVISRNNTVVDNLNPCDSDDKDIILASSTRLENTVTSPAFQEETIPTSSTDKILSATQITTLTPLNHDVPIAGVQSILDQLEAEETLVEVSTKLTSEKYYYETISDTSRPHIEAATQVDTNTDVSTKLPFNSDIVSQNTSPKATNIMKVTSSTLPSRVTPLMTAKQQWDYRKDCGVRSLRPYGRIVGGRNAYFGEWPWQVLLKESTWLGLFLKNKCGGVLLNSKYVITAAHCQPGVLASLVVVLGEHDFGGDFESLKPVVKNVKKIIVHRNFNTQSFENDLALLELETPVRFQPHIVPICLPESGDDFTGKTAFVSGWGKLFHDGPVPKRLQYVKVPIIGNSKCQEMFLHSGHDKIIKNTFICAGYETGGQDSCEGDSGGPLMTQKDDGRWMLIGTVSHGIKCAGPNLPGVYMKITAYKLWIESVINP
ncbi:uncharacterized protein LOC143227305 [Tachypleus tridentatus]|uniref:uncharacterized protein LOC143227305 n=1 Tax=Tachypleus tridentatus TaxID=6853 RepID=UPI003FD619DF